MEGLIRPLLSVVLLGGLAACGSSPARLMPDDLGLHELALTGATSEDASGTWAHLQVTTTTTDAGLAGTIRTTNYRLLLLDVLVEEAPEDEPLFPRAVRAEGELCDVWVESSSRMASTEIPEAFVAASPVPAMIGWLRPSEDGVDLGFDPTTEALGFADANDWEALDEEPDEERFADADGDGNPGVTIRVTGMAGGELYFAQRTTRTLEVTHFDGTILDGTIDWSAERVVLGATSRTLRNARPAVPTDDPAENFFRSTRVTAATTCDVIREAGLALFGRDGDVGEEADEGENGSND